MNKYFANMKVNGNTSYRKDLEDTNKKRLISLISSAARANCFVGNSYSWQVWDKNGIIVAAGAGQVNQKGNFSFYNVNDLVGTRIY